MQLRAGCSCDIEWVPGTFEATRRDNPARMMAGVEKFEPRFTGTYKRLRTLSGSKLLPIRFQEATSRQEHWSSREIRDSRKVIRPSPGQRASAAANRFLFTLASGPVL